MTKLHVPFFAISLFLFQSIVQAQAKIGIIAGPHSASILETNSEPGWSDNVKDYYSSRFAFHAGVVGDIAFPKSPLHFQPAIIYSAKGRKFATPNSADLLATSNQKINFVHQQQFLSYIDIPLNLVLKFPIGKDSRFIFGGGPQVSLLVGGKETTIVRDTIKGTEVGATNKPEKGSGAGQYKGLDFNLNALMGFEFGQFFITVNYARSFGNLYTPEATGYKNPNFRHNVIGGSVGLYFGRSRVAKAKDTDKDGILDINDECPTVAGTAFLNGCPDKDGDGVADKNDKCPTQAGPVSNNGCPLSDKDNDGVPDNLDKCPDVAGLQIYDGCPIPDKDSDGVNDFEDRCPTVPGPASNKGCPLLDTDRDGIPDKDDKCPTLPGLEKYAGCPVPDTDGDGLDDEEDKCPYVKGPKEKGGCPEIKKEITDKLASVGELVKFVPQKADLQSSTYKALDQLVKVLKQNPTLTVTISNFTNILPTAAANQKLAVERANNIMAYIGLQGIDWSRMKANGFSTDIPATPPPAGSKNPGNRTEFSVLK